MAHHDFLTKPVDIAPIQRRQFAGATADVLLSVLLDDDPASCNAVPVAPGPGGVVHGARRAQLAPAYAQPIIAITGAGD